MFDFIPPGRHLYKNEENLLHVGRLRPPTCIGFEELKNKYVPGHKTYSNIVSKKLFCSWASFGYKK